MYRITATSGTELITAATAKEWLRIDADLTRYDNVINELIEAARNEFETRTGRSLMVHTVEYRFRWEEIKKGFFYIPFDPASITKLEYYEDGALTIIDSSLYYFDPQGKRLLYLDLFPIKDEYVLTYTTQQVNEKGIIVAMKRIIKDCFDYSGDSKRQFKTAVDRAVKNYRQWKFR